MQQFTVPQFIDVEDKIIGFITVRQFVIILVAFMTMAFIYKFFDFSFFVVFGILISITAVVFAFLKINGRPFHFFILNFLQTLTRGKLRVWNNRLVDLTKEEDFVKAEIEELPQRPRRGYSSSRLTELSLIVDTQGAYQPGEQSKDLKVLEEIDDNFI